ncbi:MAG: Asp-tRNA(Asn)/Glu-tRNA(Gln) amidotransferase subunit GatA [Acidobacteriota bacterium]|nr:Asp-tRNA(Asn)/Glu-tRNA(Gln) amidotransferase subunit GatA [Acidobacteriota bacterium]
MTDHEPASAFDISRGVRRGELRAEQVVESALARLDASRPLNAIVHRDDDRALDRARALDRRRAAGQRPGPLAGVPLAVKDNICTRSMPTTCASRILRGYVSPFDATAVERLEGAGAVVVAKTNCDEFGMGSSSENGAYGPVLHPRDPGRSPGGSSGGSAVVVATRGVPVALGSDTGGSVRQPAAMCGVVGLKPTYGRVSRWGLVAHGSSLDQIGPITRTVRDAALVLRAAGGADERDATSSSEPVPDYVASLGQGAHGLTVGLLAQTIETDEIDPSVARATERAASVLAEAGARVERVVLEAAEHAIAIYYVIATAEASSNLARFDGVRFGRRAEGAGTVGELYEETRGAGFGLEVKRRILLGTFALSAGYREAYYKRALEARDRLRGEMDELLARVDLLLLPTAPQPAFPLGEKLDDPLAMYLSDVFTVIASLGGHPAISIPAPRDGDQLPVAVQLIGARFDESRLLGAASSLEERGFRTAVA